MKSRPPFLTKVDLVLTAFSAAVEAVVGVWLFKRWFYDAD